MKKYIQYLALTIAITSFTCFTLVEEAFSSLTAGYQIDSSGSTDCFNNTSKFDPTLTLNGNSKLTCGDIVAITNHGGDSTVVGVTNIGNTIKWEYVVNPSTNETSSKQHNVCPNYATLQIFNDSATCNNFIQCFTGNTFHKDRKINDKKTCGDILVNPNYTNGTCSYYIESKDMHCSYDGAPKTFVGSLCSKGKLKFVNSGTKCE